MKILFLDIDGVCNCETTSQRHRGYIGIDPYMAFLVGKIQLDTDCQVVLSSAWRHTQDGIDEVKAQVCDLLDITPSLAYTPEEQGIEVNHTHRGHEIKAWIDKWNSNTFGFHLQNRTMPLNGIVNESIQKYAILDDNNDMLPEQQEHFFKTSWLTGITPEIALAVTQYLNE